MSSTRHDTGEAARQDSRHTSSQVYSSSVEESRLLTSCGDDDTGKPSAVGARALSRWYDLVPKEWRHFYAVLNDKGESMVEEELYEIVVLSLPIIGTCMFEMLPGLVSIVLVGHIQTVGNNPSQTIEYLGSATLSIMFTNMVAIYPGFGMCSAIDTLCSQAYGAGGEHYNTVMGTILQTASLILGAMSLIMFVAGWYAPDILVALGQPQEVADLAGAFTLWMLPGILYLYEMLRKVLQAQNVATPMFYVSMVSNVINIVVGYYLVYHTSWGFLGAALARTIANISFPLILLLYAYCDRHTLKSFWHGGWHLGNAVRGIPIFLQLGVPGMLQLGLEWWAYELVTLFSGWLPNAVDALGANAVVQNITSITSMIYWGISIAGNVRIGQALGGGEGTRAHVASTLVMGLSITLSLIVCFTILLFRHVIPHIFTHDTSIQELSVKLLYVAAANQIPDAINGSVQGIFRGCGRQALGAKLFFVGYYWIALPVALWMCFHASKGVIGLWVGITVGASVSAVAGWIFLCRSNWMHLVREAQLSVSSFHSDS
jgi:MATE family multidrug resistance protein